MQKAAKKHKLQKQKKIKIYKTRYWWSSFSLLRTQKLVEKEKFLDFQTFPLYSVHSLYLLRAPECYNLINCYVRVFPILFKSKHIVCAGFHLSVKNIRAPTVNIYNFTKMVFHYKRLHFFTPQLFSNVSDFDPAELESALVQ